MTLCSGGFAGFNTVSVRFLVWVSAMFASGATGSGSGRNGPRRQDVREAKPPTPGQVMLQLLIILVIVALVAGAMGFTGIAAGAATLAKIIFAIMLIGIVLILILAFMGIAILI